jgi:formate-dependent nitrite reductase membrane component NrfD
MAESQSIWGMPIAVATFLGATESGVYIVSALAPFLGFPEPTPMKAPLLVLSIVLTLGCLAFLLFDVGRKERSVDLFRNPRSPMAIGGMCISAFLIIAIINLVLQLNRFLVGDYLIEVVTLVGLVAALGVLLYPGALFGILGNVPSWNTMLLPAIFFFSGILTGGAILTLFAVSYGVSSLENFGIQTSVLALTIYVVIFLVYLVKMYASRLVAAKASSRIIVRGRLSAYFWLATVIAGMMIPAAIFASSPFYPNAIQVTIADLCIIAGCLAMRYVLLTAAVPTPMSFSSALLYPKMKMKGIA